MNSMTLYHVKEQYNEALSQLIELADDGQIDEQTLLDTMAGLEGELTEKMKSVGAFIRNAEAYNEQVKAAKDLMDKRYKSNQKKIESLRSYLLNAMQGSGVPEVKAVEFEIKVKKNPDSVVIDDEKAIPAIYIKEKVTTSLDKTAIKKAINSGDTVDGAHLESGFRVEIK